MTLNEFARQVHKNAVQHGWWETERPIDEIIALIHSEWSEALEEYRAGRGMVWYGDDGKPEGIAVELIDGVIRILDYLVHQNAPMDWANERMKDIEPDYCFSEWEDDMSLTKLIALLHLSTSDGWEAMNNDSPTPKDYFWLYSMLVECVTFVIEWLKENGIDPEEIALKKHEYNKSRPYRHGGKMC